LQAELHDESGPINRIFAYTGAVFAPIIGGFINRYGYQTMFNLSAWAVTATAVATALFIWDAKE
jgi:hypothetical protein